MKEPPQSDKKDQEPTFSLVARACKGDLATTVDPADEPGRDLLA